MKVLVTGATGFVGRATCAELQQRGHDVAALIRRAGSEPPGTEGVLGDIAADDPGLKDAFTAAAPDCVIHLAAEIASQRSEAKINATNVDGTRRVTEATKAAGESTGAALGPKVVFCSTVVTGEANGELLEPDKPLPVETPYGRSKQEGERIVKESGLPHAIVRPSHVYGPGGWYAEEFVKRLRQPGRFAVIGKGDNWWDVIRVEDVASALVDAAEKAPSGGIYHAADDEPIRYYDFIALTAKAMNVGPPRRIPAGLARLVGGRHAVTAVTRSARSSNARLKRELGWQPRFPTAELGVPDAVKGLAKAA
jgi:nucleoside-diphosphate-sugar epimerase